MKKLLNIFSFFSLSVITTSSIQNVVACSTVEWPKEPKNAQEAGVGKTQYFNRSEKTWEEIDTYQSSKIGVPYKIFERYLIELTFSRAFEIKEIRFINDSDAKNAIEILERKIEYTIENYQKDITRNKTRRILRVILEWSQEIFSVELDK